MATVSEVEAEHAVARLAQGMEHRRVRARPRVGLDVGVLGTKEDLGPLDGERLDLVDPLAGVVVAPFRVAVGVLGAEHEPWASRTDLGGRLSEATRSSVARWRLSSPLMAAASSGSASAQAGLERLVVPPKHHLSQVS